MKKLIRQIALGGILLSAASVAAQNTNSAYFLDNYLYRYQMNPAFGNEDDFMSMPGIGNINVAMRGSLHVDDVVFPLNGKTVLFTNPGISNSMLRDIPETGKLGADVRVNLLAGGWRAWGGYNTVTIGARADVHAAIPKSFFELAKEGVSNRTYDIKDLSATANAYAEIAFSHSRRISALPGLRVGASMKFLVGIANLDAQFHEARLSLGQNEWIAATNADIYANIGGFQYETKQSKSGNRYVSGANLDGNGSIGPNGFGMAFDLGASYRWRDFQFSLAALDLGWISYTDTRKASTQGTRIVNTDAYIFNADKNAPNSFENEWNHLRDNLETLYQLDDLGNVGRRSAGLGATLNIGVDYALPYYRNLHFGLLNTTRILNRYSWTEFRLSANVRPVKCFSADANVAVGTYGAAFGWMLNYSHTGFNIFLGMDHTIGKVTKQFIPLNSNASLNFGINFPL